MKSRTLIAVAVAGACAWPVAAAARDSSRFSEAAIPHSVSESAPWMTAEDTRARQTTLNAATYVSMANLQTPFSPNESGQPNYAQEVREQAQQVASVEQTRVAVVRENERIASIERERIATLERERLEALERERIAAATPADPSVTAGGAIAETPATPEAAAPAAADITASGAPAAPGEKEARADQTAALVDTRGSAVTLSTTLEPVPADGAASAGEAADSVGATSSESATVIGTSAAPSAERSAATPLEAGSQTPSSNAAQSASAATATEAQVDAALARTGAEPASSNAYVTLHDSAIDTTAR